MERSPPQGGATVIANSGNKNPAFAGFLEPSNGLEPFTPSLPSSNETGSAGKRALRPQRDDVALSDPRSGARRRPCPGTQRDRCAARRRRPARGGDAPRRRADPALLPLPLPWSRTEHRLARRHRRTRRRRLRPRGPERRCREILETSVPGVFAVGDVRSGSVKRCATAVGDGAMVVRFVHERFSAEVAEACARRRRLTPLDARPTPADFSHSSRPVARGLAEC